MRPSRRLALLASAPTRLDFGGGWTDVPPYPEDRGGFVCNLAIERRATVRLSPIEPEGAAEVHGVLVSAACATAGVTDARISLTSDFPVGAGLGGSSAAGVALAAALAHWTDNPLSTAELAEWSRRVETSGLQMAGGYQDHYAAAFGGALGLTFDGRAHVHKLSVSDCTEHALEAQCLLLYTGESRISGETITAVLDAYRNRTAQVVDSLDRMKQLAMEMAQAIEGGSVDALGALVGEHWAHQRALHPRITTPRIDAIERAAYRSGAIGLKALGASGGGCVIVFAPADGVDRVTAAVSGFAERIPWRMSRTGVRLAEELPLSHGRVSG